MKKILLAFIVLSLISCEATKVTKTPAEVKMMTTKQFETGKDLVFKSVISLLQSESFLVEQTDKETGLINASKRTDSKKFGVQNTSTSKASFYIEEINSNLTEVKITFYDGLTQSGYYNSGYGVRPYTKNKESMIYDPIIYDQWFNNLRAEIERRRALTQ
jgi:hypothetical protein